MRKSEIVGKIAMEKKKSDEKKTRLFISKLETNDLHMKRINSNACKKINSVNKIL